MTDDELRAELRRRGLVAVVVGLLERDLRPGVVIVDASDPLGVVLTEPRPAPLPPVPPPPAGFGVGETSR